MTVKITVPELGESVLDATVSRWLKKPGEPVNVGDALVELETDKVNLEVSATASGVLARIDADEHADVKVGDVLGEIDDQAAGASSQEPGTSNQLPATGDQTAVGQREQQVNVGVQEVAVGQQEAAMANAPDITPVARKIAEERGIDLSRLQGSGPGGRITKGDVESYLQKGPAGAASTAAASQAGKPPEPTPGPASDRPAPYERQMPAQPAPAAQVPAQSAPARPAEAAQAPSSAPAAPAHDGRSDERIKLSRRRRTIAKRLVEAQQTAAMLTTFNEIDMSAVMDVRKRRNEAFQQRYGVKLGFTSFFTKAAIGALKAFPQLNSEIQGDDMVVHHYYDIGIAVGAEEGLVVPVLRDADKMSFAEIERTVAEFVKKTQDGTLSLEDLRGGTFTITNGGVFGSLLSTPILTPPQVGILGLHKIEPRPIAVDSQVVIRPMMYVALSYDHRIVDGREAVQFLVRIKELIEDPESLLLEG